MTCYAAEQRENVAQPGPVRQRSRKLKSVEATRRYVDRPTGATRRDSSALALAAGAAAARTALVAAAEPKSFIRLNSVCIRLMVLTSFRSKVHREKQITGRSSDGGGGGGGDDGDASSSTEDTLCRVMPKTAQRRWAPPLSSSTRRNANQKWHTTRCRLHTGGGSRAYRVQLTIS